MVSTAFISAEISLHFPCDREMSPRIVRTLSSHLAGCCQRDFVLPYHSLLCHLSHFSVVARFKTAVAFFTFDSLLLLGEEHEEERDTRCMVSASKEAVASDGCNHSSLHSSLPS